MPLNTIPTISAPPPPTQAPQDNFLNYQYAQGRIKSLTDSWTMEINATKYRRDVRNIKVNVKELRDRGRLKPDETFIPVRLIDTNIKREEPTYIGYLKQSRRLAIFKRSDGQSTPEIQVQIDQLEKEFTRVCQYIEWEVDFFSVRDGSATHRWDSIEICYDATKPGNICFDHVGHNNLIFSLDANKLQACDFVIRVLDVSNIQLRSFVTSDGFDQQEVETVVKSDTTNKTTNSDIDDILKQIYKIFFRLDGVIYVGWYYKECKTWLKAPEKLFLGVKKQVPSIDPNTQQPIIDPTTGQPQMDWIDEDETEYPFELLAYDITENKKICELKGRVDKDEYKQEAVCSLMSAFVNGCNRASNVMGSPKDPQGTATAPKQTEAIVANGKLWSEPMNFHNFPWPDPIMLKGVETLDLQNSQETFQQNYTVKNRVDSRKTAREVQSAEKDTALITGVEITLFSTFIRKILTRGWRIVRSQALQNKIKFMVVATPGQDPTTGQPTMQLQNNISIIQEEYELFAAGDVDVLERDEKVQKKGLFWPIVSQTALAIPFLIDWLKQAFPDEGDKYEQMLNQMSQQKNSLILGLANTLKEAVTDPATGNLKPEFQQHAAQLKQLAEGVQQATAIQG